MTTSPYRSIPALRQMATEFRASAAERQKTNDAILRQLNPAPGVRQMIEAAAAVRRPPIAVDMRAVGHQLNTGTDALAAARRMSETVAADQRQLRATLAVAGEAYAATVRQLRATFAGASLPPHLRSPALRPPIPPVAATLRKFPPVEPLR